MGNLSISSSRDHAEDLVYELAGEQIHPPAFPVKKGHAFVTVALDLDRQTRYRSGAVVFLPRVRHFIIHRHAATIRLKVEILCFIGLFAKGSESGMSPPAGHG